MQLISKKVRIGTKLLIPSILSLIVLVIATLVVTSYFFTKNYERETDKLITSKVADIDKNIQIICDKALYGASICSGLDVVQRAYKAYGMNFNLDSCSRIIENEFRSINDVIQANTGQDAKIHFTLQPDLSFIRCWSQQRGDNLAGYRKSIVKISRTYQPVTGIEVGQDGCVMRGIAPIFNERHNYLGSVEILFPIEKLTKQLKSAANEEFALFMQVDILKNSANYQTPLASANQENTIIGNFVFVDQSADAFNINHITDQMLRKGYANLTIYEVGNFKYGVIPLRDFDGNPIGVGVYQLDVNDFKTNIEVINYSLIVVLVILLFLSIGTIIYITRVVIINQIKQIVSVLNELAKGRLAEKIEVSSLDEIGEMKIALNLLTSGLMKTASFANQIGTGKFDVKFEPLSEADVLGNALLEMRNSLLHASETEQNRRIEDEERGWTTQGQAIVEEILRQRRENFSLLSDYVLKTIIKYVGAAQGGLFTLESDQPENEYLTMVASYAFDRKKYMKRNIKIGEGLVGTCAIEKQTIYKTDIPNDYVEIKSALGYTNPTSLLIVPLIFEDNIWGVIEIASLKKFKSHEIRYVEKVGESIASAIASAKINRRTSNLLLQSQNQAEELVTKELELREKLKELQEIQEDKLEQQAAYKSFVDSVNQTIIRAECSLDGRINFANPRFLDTTQYLSSEIMGQHITMIFEERDRVEFMTNWKQLTSNGKIIEQSIRHKTKYGYTWILSTFTPIRDASNNIHKILFLGININDERNKNLDYEGTIEAIENSVLMSVYKPDGTIIRDNELFLKVLGYQQEDTQGKILFDFLDDERLQIFKGIWNRVLNGVPTNNQEKMLTKSGQEKWFQGTYTGVKDYDRNIYKIIYISTEITEQKLIEIQVRRQTEMLQEKEMRLRQQLEKLHITKKEMERLRKVEEFKSNELMSALEQQRKVLMRILDYIPQKIFLKDKNGKILIVNSAFAKNFDMTSEELLGKSAFDLYDYETAKHYSDEEQDIIETGNSVSYIQEQRVGEEISILHTNKMPFYITYLNQNGMLGVQSDITEITLIKKDFKYTEQALKAEILALKTGIKELTESQS